MGVFSEKRSRARVNQLFADTNVSSLIQSLRLMRANFCYVSGKESEVAKEHRGYSDLCDLENFLMREQAEWLVAVCEAASFFQNEHPERCSRELQSTITAVKHGAYLQLDYFC